MVLVLATTDRRESIQASCYWQLVMSFVCGHQQCLDGKSVWGTVSGYLHSDFPSQRSSFLDEWVSSHLPSSFLLRTPSMGLPSSLHHIPQPYVVCRLPEKNPRVGRCRILK